MHKACRCVVEAVEFGCESVARAALAGDVKICAQRCKHVGPLGRYPRRSKSTAEETVATEESAARPQLTGANARDTWRPPDAYCTNIQLHSGHREHRVLQADTVHLQAAYSLQDSYYRLSMRVEYSYMSNMRLQTSLFSPVPLYQSHSGAQNVAVY